MKKDITLYYNAVCKEHSYDNGFCTKCGGYQPADYNESTGSYEIGNGGQMFWFAALVNGDGEHTQIQEAKPDAHGVLVSDISLKNPADENYEWKPIGEFKGIFDGQNHTISDFSMTKVNDQSIGFFQNLMSDPNETDEAKKATLKNFTLNGTIVTTAEAASAVGGVVGTTSDSVIRRVNSNVNIGSGLIYYIGGIVGEINAATSIEESTYSGKIVLDYSFYGVGGIVGFVTDDDTYAGSTKIKDCANYGLITYYKVENHGGRGYSGGITGQVALGEEDFILSDCYNYGSVLAEEWKEIYGAISGYCAAKKDGIKNNYYLDTLPVKGFLGEAEIANDEELAKAKTAEQFKSGEEAYLLNNEVTDGSQVWYQNIDNGETPDAYPVLDDTHGTVQHLLDEFLSPKYDVAVTYVDGRTVKEFEDAIRPETKMIILESPTTLLFNVVDLEGVAKLAKEHGIKTYIDNTYSTPIFQKPLDMGIDIVMHTMTKYIGGHSDLVGGVLVSKDEEFMREIMVQRDWFGGVLGPMEAWLAIRGLRTLDVRMQRHYETAMEVAKFLEKQPKIKRVFFTGLESHPQYELARKQQKGECGLMSLEIDGTLEETETFVNSLKLFEKGCSWGGFESLAIAYTYNWTEEQCAFLNVSRNIVRIHCGLEGTENLIADLQQALDKIS